MIRMTLIGGLLVPLSVCGCQRSKPHPEPAPSASLAPATSNAAAAADKPVTPSVIELRLRDFPVGRTKLPGGTADMPRTIAALRGPQMPFKLVASGSSSLCGINYSGNVVCWGGALDGQKDIGYTTVASGADFGIGLTFAGVLATFGASPVRVQGDDPLGRRSEPGELPDGEAGAAAPRVELSRTFKAVGAQGQHACAVETSGRVACWTKDASCDLTPPADFVAREVAVGEACFACAAGEDGLRCWGAAAPVESVEQRETRLAAGNRFVCATAADDRARCWGTTAPDAEVIALAAAGTRVCWLDKQGKLGCSSGLDRAIDGRHTALAVTKESTCVADETGYWRCQGAAPPEFDMLKQHPAWAPTARERQEKRAARLALLSELASHFPKRSVPLELTPDTTFPIGGRVETKYLPLVQNVGLDWPLRVEERTFHYAFQLDGLAKGTYLVVADEGALLLHAFDENGELRGVQTIAARRPYDFTSRDGCVYFNEVDSVGEELLTSTLSEKGVLRLHGQRTREKMEFEPIQKRNVYQCYVLTGERTIVVTDKTWRPAEIGWSAPQNRIGLEGCGESWPLKAPFFVRGKALQPGSPAVASYDACSAYAP